MTEETTQPTLAKNPNLIALAAAWPRLSHWQRLAIVWEIRLYLFLQRADTAIRQAMRRATSST
jgi:hypothetical protein